MSADPFDLLERDLVGAVERRRVTAPVRPRWRRGRTFLAAAALALCVSAAALAAGSLLSPGAPVGHPSGKPPSPDAHDGTTVPGSVRLLAADVPDPDGGLPWGLRTFETSRGYGCVQVGRVQDGRLGVLALVERGGAVRERGLFHELRPAVVAQGTTRVPLDGGGNAFLALHWQTTTDAAPEACACARAPRGA